MPAARAAWANALAAEGWRRGTIAEATESTASMPQLSATSTAGEVWLRGGATLWVGWVDNGSDVAVNAVMVVP